MLSCYRNTFHFQDLRNQCACVYDQLLTFPAINDHIEAKGLYGVPFLHFNTLAAIWGKDIATGEGVEGLGEAVTNMEKELTMKGIHGQEEEEEREMSREPPRPSLDSFSAYSTSSSNKRRRKDKDKGNGKEASLPTDPLLAMMAEFHGDLQGVSKNFGNIAAAMQREAEAQEKARKEEYEQTIEEKFVEELRKLGFTSTEIIKAASVFVRVLNQMNLLFAIPKSLRREFILNMLDDKLTCLHSET